MKFLWKSAAMLGLAMAGIAATSAPAQAHSYRGDGWRGRHRRRQRKLAGRRSRPFRRGALLRHPCLTADLHRNRSRVFVRLDSPIIVFHFFYSLRS